MEDELRHTQKQAFSEGTIKNLLTQWRAFYAFCRIYAIFIWPVTAHILCLFVQFLSFNLKSPDSIRNYLSGVRTLHLLTNHKCPDLNDFEIKITMKGLRRRMKHTVTQAAPITPLILAQIHPLLNFRKKVDIVFWAVLLLGFFMMVRASNLVPRSVKKWSPIKQLSRSSIAFNKQGMVVKVLWSKTIQFRQKVLEIPVYAIPNLILCPIKAVRRVLHASKVKGNGPLLAVTDKHVFTYGMLQKKLKQAVQAIGLKKSRYSSHSLRRGAVEWAERNNIQESMIKIYGEAGLQMHLKDIYNFQRK